MKKVFKVIIIIVVIAAVLAAGWFFLMPMITGGGSFNDNVAYVSPVGGQGGGTPFLNNRYSAVIESQEVISVDTDAEKKIKDVFVKEGDDVKKGDKLFEYNVEEMQFQLDQAKLDREQAQSEIKSYNDQIATLEKEQKTATKNQRLSLENQIEANKLNLKKAEYSLNSLDKTIKKLENSIKNSVVKSSVDGKIRTVDDPTAEAYITITSSGDFRVKASISEEHISEFFVDEEITIRSRTDESLTWSGKVVSIDTAKPITSNNVMGLDTTTKYPVYISLDTTEGLLIGQHVTVEEAVGSDNAEADDGLWIDEFFIADLDTAPYVWIEENGALKKQSVELGEYDEELYRYEIVSGLSDSDYIAFPEERFFEGMETAHGFEDLGIPADDMSIPADDMAIPEDDLADLG